MRTSFTPETKGWARQLIEYEAESEHPVIDVCEKLRKHLGPLVGMVGFRTLLRRALSMSKTEAACFEDAFVNEEGTLVGFDDGSTRLTTTANDDGADVLVGRLLALLETFIGAALTRQLLLDIWPITADEPES